MLQIYNKTTGKFIGVSYKESSEAIEKHNEKYNLGSVWTTEDVIESTTILPEKKRKILGKDIVIKSEDIKYIYKNVSLALLKSEQEAGVNENCKNEILSDFESNALGVSHIYTNSEIDQVNLIAMVSCNAGYSLKCKNTVGVQEELFREHSATQLKKVLEDSLAIKNTKLEKSFNIKKDIAQATKENLPNAGKWNK